LGLKDQGGRLVGLFGLQVLAVINQSGKLICWFVGVK
jgi:hypothetical protein